MAVDIPRSGAQYLLVYRKPNPGLRGSKRPTPDRETNPSRLENVYVAYTEFLAANKKTIALQHSSCFTRLHRLRRDVEHAGANQ